MSRTERLGDTLAALAVLAFGVAVCLHYGRMGFMPLDQSIVWDAGWRLLGGQVPFRDFVTPTSLAPGLMQAAVFAALGITWLAYCVHAAVLNGLFALAVYGLLRGERLPILAAVVFGATSAVFFYPPFGVPYGDQHSFFFALLALAAASIAARAVPPRSTVALVAVPVLLVAAYLSKPVPAGFLVPAVALVALWPGEERWGRKLLVLLVSSLAAVAAVALVFLALRADLGLAWDYLVRMPLASGARRTLHAGWLEDRALAMVRVGGRSGALFPWAALAASAAVSGLLVGLIPRGPEARRRAREAVRPLAIAVLLWVGTVMFVGVTRNQARNGHALLPLVLGLLSVALVAAGRAWSLASDGGEGRRLVARLARAGSLLLLLVAVVDAARFNATVNATRMVHDAGWDEQRAESNRGEGPASLRFLEWGLPSTRYTPRQLRDLVDALAIEPRPVLLVSDSLIVYALAGKPSINPNLWYHPGVSMPRVDDLERRERLEALFVERLERASPGLVVFDPPPGSRLFRLEMLPRVDAWLRARRCGVSRIGPFPTWRLCGDDAASMGGGPAEGSP